FCLGLRHEVFDLAGDRVAVRAGATGRVAALMHRYFGAVEETPAGPGPAAAPTAQPPLAMPVTEPPPFDVPMAAPVGPPGHHPPPPPGRAGAARAAHHALSPGGAAAPGDDPDTPVGIDLGTTFSVVAYLDAQGRPCSIANASGDLLTPSVVLFEEGG